MSSLHYDQHQFERRAMPVNGKNGISFDDAHFMQTQTHGGKPAAWVPPFAMNDKQFQRVLLVRAWHMVYGRILPPADIDRDTVNKIVTQKILEGHEIKTTARPVQREIHAKHIASVRNAGGFLQLHAAIAFRSWRLGMNSVAVAESLGMTPTAVRQALWRLRDTAKKLGYDVGRAGHSAGTKRFVPQTAKTLTQEVIELCASGIAPQDVAAHLGYAKPAGQRRVYAELVRAGLLPAQRVRLHILPEPNVDVTHATALYKTGMPVRQIAVKMGYRLGHGGNSVRRALMKAGVYQNEKPGHTGPALDSIQAAS